MDEYCFKVPKGLNRNIVTQISEQKNEPGWMTDFRLRALEIFERLPMPTWGADLSALDPYDIFYYIKPLQDTKTSWDDIPDTIKNTFDRLGIPQAEQRFLAGVGAQYESEVVYKSLRAQWAEKGVLFLDTSSALHKHLNYLKNILPRYPRP